MGDEDIYEAARTRIDADYQAPARNGATHLDASPFTAMLTTMARFGRRHAWHDLANRDRPEAWRLGPRLAQAPYPDVLVARAVTDGKDLDLELVPGAEPGRFGLVLDRLTPRAPYRITGARITGARITGARITGAAEESLTADDAGAGVLAVDLDARQRVRVTPGL
jgi:hypothetical protein